MLSRLLLFVALLAMPSARAAGIDWDPASIALIEEGAGYGRMIEMPGGNLLCAYSQGPRIFLRKSEDGGRTWKDAVQVV